MQRRIDVALLPGTIPHDAELESSTAIVIDVLRATSVMAAAGHHGIRKIQTCETIDGAMEIATSRECRPLLCGERNCKRIEGFDLGNSPLEYSAAVVSGRDMVLTTTNGTIAIRRVAEAQRVLAASFLNLTATLDAIRNDRLIQIVCAGTNGQISREDVLLAGAMIDRMISSQADLQLNDSASIARSVWLEAQNAGRPLNAELRNSIGGRNLVRVGYEADIDRCAQLDTIPGIVERVTGEDPVFEYRSADEDL